MVYYFLTNCQEKNGLIDSCEEGAMVSSLSMKKTAGMPEILDPTGRSFFFCGGKLDHQRSTCYLAGICGKVCYVLFSEVEYWGVNSVGGVGNGLLNGYCSVKGPHRGCMDMIAFCGW